MFNFVKSLVKTFAIGIGVSMMAANSIEDSNFSNTQVTEVIGPVDGTPAGSVYKTSTLATSDGSFKCTVRTKQNDEDNLVSNADTIDHTRWYNMFTILIVNSKAGGNGCGPSRLVEAFNAVATNQLKTGRVTLSLYDGFGKFLGIKYKLLEKKMMIQSAEFEKSGLGRDNLNNVLLCMDCMRLYIKTHHRTIQFLEQDGTGLSALNFVYDDIHHLIGGVFNTSRALGRDHELDVAYRAGINKFKSTINELLSLSATQLSAEDHDKYSDLGKRFTTGLTEQAVFWTKVITSLTTQRTDPLTGRRNRYIHPFHYTVGDMPNMPLEMNYVFISDNTKSLCHVLWFLKWIDQKFSEVPANLGSDGGPTWLENIVTALERAQADYTVEALVEQIYATNGTDTCWRKSIFVPTSVLLTDNL